MQDLGAGHCSWCGALTEEATELADALAEAGEVNAQLEADLGRALQERGRMRNLLEYTATLEPDDVRAYLSGVLAGVQLREG